MTRKQIKQLAKELVKAEKENDIKKLEELTEKLSLTDMLAVDSYIQENKMLT